FGKIIKDGDQGFILTTLFQASSIGLVSGLDSLGDVRWTRKYQDQLGGHFNTLTAYKDIGLILTGDNYNFGSQSAWILKTDRKGRIGDCPSESFNFTVTDVADPGIIQSIIIEVPAHSLIQSSVTVHPFSITSDTLCAFACITPNEICNNNLDDDEDGLFDCLDPECLCEENQCKPKEANIWYFGNQAGLDFSSEPPTVLTNGKTDNLGVSATMSDENGNLMFYTDGNTVYNRFHQPMPNGDLQIGSDNTALIIPHPTNTSLYYVFHLTPGAGVFYSLVDMSLDEGRGDVISTQKNVLLLFLATGMSAVKSCSFNGYWLLLRDRGNQSVFFAYRINENGLDGLNPVQSNSGQIVNDVFQMKISPDGKRVACTVQNNFFLGDYKITIHDFDPYTGGMVFNSQILEEYITPNGAVGVEFSPTGRFLYVTGSFDGLDKVLQYDLEAGGIDAIRNSKIVVAAKQSTILGYPQLGPNGKIYLSSSVNFAPVSFHLDVIHQPNLSGLACQYQAASVFLPPSGSVGYGLCNFISSNFKTPHIAFPNNAPDTICAINTPINYQIPNVQCDVDSISWQTENLSAEIQTNYQYATIRYLSPGSGRLFVTAYTPCGTATDTLNVLVVAPLNKTLNLGPDLTVCDNGVFSFNAGSGYTRYQWSDGTADSTTTTLFPGKYWVNVWDLCGNFQTDTITVSIAQNSVLDLGADLPQQCSGFSVHYHRPANFADWKWAPADFLSCADCPNVTLSPNTSASWVVVAKTSDGCISVDTLRATIRDTLLFSRDTSVCVGQQLALFGAHLPADTTAEFFLPAPGLGCDTLLTINVLGIENAASGLSTTICPNTVFDFNGTLLPADTVAVFHFHSALACDSTVTVTVHAYPALNLVLPMDTTISVGASVLLDATITGTGPLDFMWSPVDALSCTACPDPLANPLDTITYTLAVTDGNGCTLQESVTVRVNEECRVRIPNAFTPNGDGSNDLFRPITDPCVRTVRLWKILNRWGESVFTQINFSATDPALGWDGNWEGKPQPSDVLIWVAEFEYYDGRRESQKGEVTLIR
ncbi:MAG: gliding motility-associated C-terminal domain-containing protein, partial [Phycisphaerae bacterium]|nr:gliding motility-associated C-terminal domain-containing protein [Saprospiraceae bacterium]